MKKICYFLSLIALVILPIRVSAISTIDYTISNPDANGIYTVEIFEKVSADTPFTTFDGNIVGQHNIIREVSGTDQFLKDETQSTIDQTGTSARIVTNYINGIYNGTGDKIKVAEFKYVHDPSYTGDEEHKITLSVPGSTDVVITEKTTPNAKTGSALPYVGIAAGLVLIASAYIISKRSTKLYRM